MIVTVIGKKKGAFVDEKSGRNISYEKVNCTYPFDVTQSGVEGANINSFSCVDSEIFKNLVIGMKYNLYFNEKGKIEMYKDVK